MDRLIADIVEADVRNRLPLWTLSRVEARGSFSVVATSTCYPDECKTFHCVAATEGSTVGEGEVQAILDATRRLRAAHGSAARSLSYLCFVDTSGLVSYYQLDVVTRVGGLPAGEA